MHSQTEKIKAPSLALDNYLKRAQTYLIKNETIRIILNVLLYLLVAGLFLIVLNWLFLPSSPLRIFLLSLYIFVAIGLFLSKMIRLMRKTRDLRTIAIHLERTHPELNTRLIAAYDLKSENTELYGYSSSLIARAIEKAVESLSSIDYKKLSPSKYIVKRIREALAIILLITIFAIIFPGEFIKGARLAFNPFAIYVEPPRTVLVVSPGDAKVQKMGEIRITIRAEGEKPSEVILFRKHEGIQPVEFRLTPDTSSVFTYTFKEIRTPFEYYAEANGFRTRRYKVDVVELPQILSFQITLYPPSYTGLPPEKLDRNNGNINLLYGTYAEYSIKPSKKVKEAYIFLLSDSTKIPLTCSGDTVFGKFIPKKEGSYYMVLMDSEGNKNPDPIPYRIQIYRDEYPVVRIVSPAADINLTEEMKLDIVFSAEDDYGFSSFYLKYRKMDDTTRIGSSVLPSVERMKKRVEQMYNWDVSSLNLAPDEVVTYWVEVYDNDFITGPKLARSKEYAIRLPSIEEIVEQVAQESEAQTKDFLRAIEEEKKLIEESKKFSQELLGKEELKWEDKQKATEFVKKQEEIAEKLTKLSEDMTKTLENLEKNALVAGEIVEKIQEIQRILEDIMTPELRDAIKRIREALESMDPNLLRSAMRQFQQNLEELLNKLDQTLSLLKRVQIEQKLESLTKLASKLKEEQDKINEALKSSTLSQDSLNKLASAEDKINKGIENLKENLKELSDAMREFPDIPGDILDGVISDLEKGEVQYHASMASNNMRGGNPKGAYKEGEKVSEGISGLISGLNSAMQGLQMSVKKEILDAMRNAISALFYTSNLTEERYLSIDPSLLDDKMLMYEADITNRINEGLKNILDDLYDIGGKTFLLSPVVGALVSKARESLANSVKQLSSRNAIGARAGIMDALVFENAAIDELLRSMESVSSASSASGMESFFEQLQKMCNAQGELNMATIPFLGMGQSSLTPAERATLARLAAQQEALRKSLEELQKEYERYANLRAKFDDVLEDMDKVVRDLQQQNVNQETIQRQLRIHSRMLEAQKSLHRQDFTEKRESKTGKDIIRQGPKALPDDLGAKKTELKEQIIKSLSDNYPRQYDKQIKAYFKKLEELTR